VLEHSPARRDPQVRLPVTSSGLTSPRVTLVPLTGVVLAIKMSLLILDPNPQFFLGDSGSYLHTALTGWIPPDRSYLYGYVIRWLCLGSGSLFSLLLAQIVASAFSAVNLGWLLMRFFALSDKVALVIVIFYCVDPLQLMYERFVMAETFSLTATLLFVTFLFLFVEKGARRYLVLASIVGILAVAFRTSLLPAITVLSFAAPVIRFIYDKAEPRDVRVRLKVLFTSFCVVGLSHFILHTGYKHLTGRLSSAPPAYQYADGFSVLSSWSPVMTLADSRAAGIPDAVVNNTWPRTFDNRRGQRWAKGGLTIALQEHSPNAVLANAAAKQISWHILRRDPLGVVGLAIHTYLRAWEHRVIKACTMEDAGNVDIPSALAQRTAARFHFVADDMRTRRTITKVYFLHDIQWYRALLLSSFLVGLTTLLCDSRSRPYLLLVTIFSGAVMLTIMGLAVDNSVRYLHPLSWTMFFCLGYWANFVTRRIEARSSPSSSL
jgi:hypothetical protein